MTPHDDACDPLSNLEKRVLETERRQHMLTEKDLAALREEVSAGVVEGLQTLLSDPKVIKDFWRGGYSELAEHTSNGATQWVGKRILTWFITGVFTLTTVYLLTRGIPPGPKT